MKNPFKKAPPVMITLKDDETGREYSMEAKPGTPEFAAGVKRMVDRALLEVKTYIGIGNWDELCTTMFACSYDNKQGIAQCIDGNNDQLLLLMAITIHHMADNEMERQKFLPKPKGGNEIIAMFIQQLAQYINSLDHDDAQEKPSAILTK